MEVCGHWETGLAGRRRFKSPEQGDLHVVHLEAEYAEATVVEEGVLLVGAWHDLDEDGDDLSY